MPPRAFLLPLPADELADDAADRAGQRLDEFRRLVERVAGLDRDVDLDAALAGDLRPGDEAELVERHPEQPGDRQRVVPRRLGPGSMSTRAYDGSSGDAAVDVHGWISKPAKLAAHTSAGAPSISRYSRVSPVLARRVRPAPHPQRGVGRHGLVEEAALGAVDAVGEAVEVDRAAGEPHRHPRGDGGVVGDDVAFGDRLGPPAAGHHHLVEVGDLLRDAGDGPVRPWRRELAQRGSSAVVAAGQRPGRPSAMSTLVRALSTDRGWSSGSQPATASSSFLCISSHWSSSAPALAPVRTSTKRPRSLRPMSTNLSSPRSIAVGRVGLVGVLGVGLPPAVVPQDDVALAVAARDDPLEPAVGVRVVLDLDGQRLARRVEARALRHGPADEHAVDLEAQVVVQPAGPVALDEEPVATVGAAGRPGRAAPATW